jgi:hypothetical protein
MELEVVMDLDLLSQTIIFGSILTTFELSHFFGDIGFSLKPNHYQEI